MKLPALIFVLIAAFCSRVQGSDLVFTCGNDDHHPRHSVHSAEEAKRYSKDKGCKDWDVSSPDKSVSKADLAKIRKKLEKDICGKE